MKREGIFGKREEAGKEFFAKRENNFYKRGKQDFFREGETGMNFHKKRKWRGIFTTGNGKGFSQEGKTGINFCKTMKRGGGGLQERETDRNWGRSREGTVQESLPGRK